MSLKHQEPALDLTDGDLISALVEITKKEWGGVAHFSVERFSSRENTTYTAPAEPEELEHRLFGYDGLDAKILRTITRCTLQIGSDHRFEESAISITYTRNPLILELTTHNDNNAARFIKAISATHREGLAAPRITENLPAAEDNAARALAEQVALLRDLVNKQAKSNEQVRDRLEYDHTTRVESLRNDYDGQLKAVRQDHEAWAAELRKRTAEKEQEIENRAKELAERETKLDLHSERDARRSLRKQIQAAAATMFEKPDLSEQAKASFERVAKACRWTIVGAVVLLAIALFVPPGLELGLEKVLSSEVIWLVWSMRILGGITLAAALIYYVSSLSAWSRQVSSIELRSKQFALDIDRASWLVEMALEYEKEGKALPPAMVESFTRGLFDGGAQGPQHEQPSASLLHLIQNAESLKVGAAGAELTLTGKQIRRADAQAGKNS